MRLLLALFAWLVLASPAPAAEAEAGPAVHVVIIHHPGPAWDKTKPFREQAGLEAHIAHYRALLEKGELSMGGPFLDDTGGMMISKPGADLAALSAYAAEDPAVKSGLLTFEAHAWLIGMAAD